MNKAEKGHFWFSLEMSKRGNLLLTVTFFPEKSGGFMKQMADCVKKGRDSFSNRADSSKKH